MKKIIIGIIGIMFFMLLFPADIFAGPVKITVTIYGRGGIQGGTGNGGGNATICAIQDPAVCSSVVVEFNLVGATQSSITPISIITADGVEISPSQIVNLDIISIDEDAGTGTGTNLIVR